MWETIRTKFEVHVVPVNDIIEHKLNLDCSCGPRLEFVNGSALVIHNAADCREQEEIDYIG